jgi:pre-mRNA-splicing factor SYF1
MTSSTALSTQDLSYEDDVLRDPFSWKNWWFYLDFKSSASPATRQVIFERALKRLPGSYKLWHRYVTERVDEAKNFCVTHQVCGFCFGFFVVFFRFFVG